MPEQNLNPDALAIAALELDMPCASCAIGNDPGPCKFCESTAERVIREYLSALPAQPDTVFDALALNRAGWTCGTCEPGDYGACSECREKCDELADFLNRNHPTQPDTVNSVEELEALPPCSVIVDKHGDAGLIEYGHVKFAETAKLPMSYVAKRYLPATVIYRPVEG